VLQQKNTTAPAEKERSRCILISKTSKKLLCDEQETKKTNKKEETKVKDKEALPQKRRQMRLNL
jgi:hypothetical protein